MGVSPVQYLLSPRLIAAVAMVPLLCVVYTCVGMAGAWLVAVEWLHVDPGVFIARAKQYAFPKDFLHGGDQSVRLRLFDRRHLVPSRFLRFGRRARRGLATTRAVVQSAVAILVANYVLTSWLTTD